MLLTLFQYIALSHNYLIQFCIFRNFQKILLHEICLVGNFEYQFHKYLSFFWTNNSSKISPLTKSGAFRELLKISA